MTCNAKRLKTPDMKHCDKIIASTINILTAIIWLRIHCH